MAAAGLGTLVAGAPPGRGAPQQAVHGVDVADPFRSLEDVGAPATREWVSSQEARLSAYLDGERVKAFRLRLEALATYDAYSAPVQTPLGFYFSKAPAARGSAAKSVHRGDDPRGAGAPVLDVQAIHGADAALGAFVPSPDGRRLAYVLHRDRSAWGEVHIRVVGNSAATVEVLPDVHRLSMLQWTADSRELFYTTFARPANPTAPVGRQTLKRHRIGSPVSTDVAVPWASNGSELDVTNVRVTEDGRYAVLLTQRGTDQRTSVVVLDLRRPDASPVALVPTAEAAYVFLGSRGDTLQFYTDADAPRGRVVEVSLGGVARPAWRTLVPEAADAIAARDQTGGNALGAFGGHLVLMYLEDGRPYLRVFDRSGRPVHRVDLPPAGSIWGGLVGRESQPEVYFQFLGLADPATIMSLNVRTGRTAVVRRADLPVDPSQYETTQVFYRGKDGTRIPMFVVRRASRHDGPRPTLMYGYGALAWVSFVWYQPHLLAWLDMGGLYVQPSIRGGGEYGKAWHDAALRTRKQTAVDDYLAAADHLVKAGYTEPKRLVATGGSLSAPLAAAAIAQRPDLFGAAVIDRPVSDLVRYERFTGAQFWVPEFGSVERADEFVALHRLSPYHEALRGTCMPPTLVMAGEFDQTAPPLHAFKLVAARQGAASCPAPTFLKLMRGAGHDFGKTPQQVADSYASELGFLTRALGLR